MYIQMYNSSKIISSFIQDKLADDQTEDESYFRCCCCCNKTQGYPVVSSASVPFSLPERYIASNGHQGGQKIRARHPIKVSWVVYIYIQDFYTVA